MNRKYYFLFVLCMLNVVCANAQKALYIPNEWRSFRSDTLLYKEVDTENKYTWSKTRSKESQNFIVYWDKYYTKSPSEVGKSNFYYVDIDDLLKKAESFYALNVGKLTFCDEATSKISKYKTMILINHTETWTCYGGGYDFTVPALWLNPSTCKPVGHSVAHEVGHSFQYMCYSDVGGHAGFHDAIGSGSTFWEQTAQWQANQSYPDMKWSQSWSIFSNTANYAMTHEWMRYQSYWWHYYLTEKYGIDFIGRLWRHPMSKAADANEVFMDMMGYDVNRLYQEYFDYAMKMATCDLEVTRNETSPYKTPYTYKYVPLSSGAYQVAFASCPQATGFNVIPLNVPEAGTEVSVDFTSLKKSAPLATDDPTEYFNGDSYFVKLNDKKFYNCYNNKNYNTDRAFRIGYVALLKDGTRHYLYEDSLYCSGGGSNNITETISAIVPEDTKELYLVVVPAPKSYYQHKWNDNITDDDQWPYTVQFDGTNIYGAAIISPEMAISDVTLTYDVYIPKANDYSGIYVDIEGEAASALGTAFQMQASQIGGKMVAWSAAGPKDGQIMFYAVNANGKISNTGSSANGYGHWFDASGNRGEWANGYLYSELNTAIPSFYVGQYPNKLTTGKNYTISQAMKYVRGNETATANFIFRVHIQNGRTEYKLSEIDSEYTTGISSIASPAITNNSVYTIDGRLVKDDMRLKSGIYIKNGKKYFK